MDTLNTAWLEATPPGWQKLVYVVDDPSAALKPPSNKGRESSVYLTYIIDNYEKLTGTIIFSHASRYQWHNDDPLYDGLQVLRHLQLPYIQTQGYVSLRCVWTIGCPAEIHPVTEALAPPPASNASSQEARAGSFYKEVFQELFPGDQVPEVVAAPCCAQFAVTAERIRTRPKSDYERYRGWLEKTPLRDSISGRIMEYSWHIIFGKDPVSCPNAKQCYCNLYGICDLNCEEEGVCSAMYTLAKYSVLPEGWPDVDWDGKWRNVTEIRGSLPYVYGS
ncbi:uncharacterized protein MYCFIDRAFT_189039 [Pseudocercospora fijiensis CIRAD86]|uniref:Uncharacterized protein n=1 Tax=Pseudocercospora fijiensis (strain CIRAD86) TaxID=383855 RepID=M2ZTL7_PSEFD|nr:uncharacterized protein MYCFIDRAFT_189039 [Pseudocercospora fijiensis CIRAD86]EME82349.1 hypothetical protein MYCFIDRAFT_189039 [Pseudocercospora fijiensis CIRAD86]